MSDALDQGISVTELQAMDEPVDIAAHTTAAFIGRALRGPLNTPIRVASFAQFTHRFGGEWGRSGLGPAVRQFFEHGGKDLYVVRVANDATGARLSLPGEEQSLDLCALEPGSTEQIRAAVDYDGCQADEFNLTLQRLSPSSGLVVDQEIYRRVSTDSSARRFVVEELGQSSLVRVSDECPAERPLATSRSIHSVGMDYVAQTRRGSDGEPLTDYDIVGSAEQTSGLFALDAIAHIDLLYVAVAGVESDLGPAAILVAERYARRRGAMLILDPRKEWETARDAVAGVHDAGFSSANIVSYFPRMRQKNDPAAQPRPVGGAIAGLLCKLDARRGCWETLDQPGFGLSRSLIPAMGIDTDDTARLIREGLNVIATGAAGRARVCGSVTLARVSEFDKRFESLTLRRLSLTITNTVERATRWAVFEQGGRRMADRVRQQVYAYLSVLADRGAFSERRFDVQCEWHPGESNGITVMLAFRPAASDDFICLSIHQDVQGARIAATAFAPNNAECA